MHPALIAEDILDIVFAQAGASDKPTLAGLARTCKVFHDPAARILWKHLPGLKPITCVFPKAVFFIGEKKDSFVHLRMDPSANALIKAGFVRLKAYTRHVHSIRYQWPAIYSKRKVLHPSIWQQIYEHDDCPRYLFPNAEEVYLPCAIYSPSTILPGPRWHEVQEAICYPSLVIGPAVKSIVIWITDGSNTVDYVIDAGATLQTPRTELKHSSQWSSIFGRVKRIGSFSSPSLSSLAFKHRDTASWPQNLGFTEPGHPQISPFILDVSSDTSSLVHLDIACLVLTGNVVSAVGRIPGLSTLKISMFKSYASELRSLPPDTIFFPSLQRLTLNIVPESMDASTNFIVLLKTTVLHVVKLKVFIYDQESWTPEPVFRALSSNPNTRATVKELIVKPRLDPYSLVPWDEQCQQQQTNKFEIGQDSLEALYPLSDLTRFEVSAPCYAGSITNGVLLSAFKSWPLLETFGLMDEDMILAHPQITLGGVYRALQHVPRLRSLTLRFIQIDPLNALFDIDPDVDPSCLRPHSNLNHWNVCTSTIDHGDMLAEWMIEHLPALRLITSYSLLRAAFREVAELGDAFEKDSALKGILTSELEPATHLNRWNDVHKIINQRK